MNKTLIFLAVLGLMGTGLHAQSAKGTARNNHPDKENVMDYDAIIRTSLGDIKVKLFDEAPKHKEQFLRLAKAGFYDSTWFHRVIEGFMIQGGDPNTKDPAKAAMAGMGGNEAPLPAEISPKYFHVRGMLCAARRPDQVNPERQSGTQFYIVQGQKLDSIQVERTEQQMKGMLGADFSFPPEVKKAYMEQGGAPWLDMQYTIFGQVVEGMDVVDKIAAQPKKGNPQQGSPMNPVKMSIIVKEG